MELVRHRWNEKRGGRSLKRVEDRRGRMTGELLGEL